MDGLRALAVTAVPLYHYVSPKFPGPLGVLLFFVLSGFLITGSIFRNNSLGAFYKRRIVRIFPAFYLFILLHFIAYGPGIPGRLPTAVYLSNYYMGLLDTYILGLTHTWSLAVEEQFYLLWPLVLITQRGARGRLLLYSVLAATVAVQAYRIVLFHSAAPFRYAEYAFEARCDALLVGCLIALIWEQAPGLIQLANTTVARAIALTCIAASIICDSVWPVQTLAYLYTSAALCFSVVVINAILQADRPGWSWLNWKPLRFVGRISYGIYLYHCLVFEKLVPALGLRWSLAILTGLGGSVLLATASYYLMERPLVQLVGQFRTRPLRSKAAVAS